MLPVIGCNYAINAIVIIILKILGEDDDDDDDETPVDEDDGFTECHALADRICRTSRVPLHQARASANNKTQVQIATAAACASVLDDVRNNGINSCAILVCRAVRRLERPRGEKPNSPMLTEEYAVLIFALSKCKR